MKIIKILKKKGFTARPGKGSHLILVHPDGRRTVVPVHNKPLAKGTLNSILKQAEITL